MDITAIIAEEIGAKRGQVEAAIKLIDEGNTIPFIARYRKEATGSLDDEKLRALHTKLTYLRNLEARKQEVIELIDEQGKLTDELRKAILAAEKLVTVEDLYRPYKQKKKTRAEAARKRGLAPLAEFIMLQTATEPVENEALKYVTGKIEPESADKEAVLKAAEKEVLDAAAAIAGASDIIAEDISDDARFREHIRRITEEEGKIKSEAKDPEAALSCRTMAGRSPRRGVPSEPRKRGTCAGQMEGRPCCRHICHKPGSTNAGKTPPQSPPTLRNYVWRAELPRLRSAQGPPPGTSRRRPPR